MSKLLISTGINPNDGNGDTLLSGANKINSNFNEVYGSIGNGSEINIGLGKTVISTNSLSNVGIGTTTAQEKLHVNGNLLVDGNFDIKNLRITSGIITSTSGIITYYGDSSKLSNLQWETVASGIHTSKNVGIGTTNPSTSLYVVGDQYVSGILTATTFYGSLVGSSGIVTNFTSANTTITNLVGTSGTITNLTGTAGTITTLNSTNGTITNLDGTYLNYSGISSVGSLSIGSTEIVSSTRQLKNIVSLDQTTISTIESAISNSPNTFTELQISGISTFTDGPVLIGTGASTGTASQRLQVTGGLYVSNNIGIGSTIPSALLNIGAGGTTVGSAPLEFVAGSLLTVPESGAFEYDGTTFFATPNTSYGRAVIPTTIYTSGQGTALTVTSEATTQILFPSTNDTIVLPVGTYKIEFGISMTRAATSTTAATLNVTLNGFGSGSVGTFSGIAVGSVNTSASSTVVNGASITASTAISASNSTASTAYSVVFNGILRITTAGTFQPRYSLSANLSGATGSNSISAANYMILQSLSTSGVSTSTGSWS